MALNLKQKPSKLGYFSVGPVAAVQNTDTMKVCQRCPSVEKSLPALCGVKRQSLLATNCRTLQVRLGEKMTRVKLGRAVLGRAEPARLQERYLLQSVALFQFLLTVFPPVSLPPSVLFTVCPRAVESPLGGVS